VFHASNRALYSLLLCFVIFFIFYFVLAVVNQLQLTGDFITLCFGCMKLVYFSLLLEKVDKEFR
jgi:hypothetical protein